ncbi:MAG: molybdenum cofactor biosynthesis protein MoaE [Terriglobia bacterium]
MRQLNRGGPGVKVTVLFFGLAHDLTGLAQETAEVPDGESLETLWRRYEVRFPRLAQVADSMLLSVNQTAEQPARILCDGDEVAFLPPVSGGGGDLYQITREPIDRVNFPQLLGTPEDGAVVVFEGIVRNHSRGRKTIYLEYEAYEPMAISTLRQIGEDVRRQFPVSRTGMVHRIGRIEIGEASVLIAVTSAHRAAAFDGCRYAIDELKRRAPIWKKEYFEDGSAWADGEPLAPALAQQAQ